MLINHIQSIKIVQNLYKYKYKVKAIITIITNHYTYYKANSLRSCGTSAVFWCKAKTGRWSRSYMRRKKKLSVERTELHVGCHSWDSITRPTITVIMQVSEGPWQKYYVACDRELKNSWTFVVTSTGSISPACSHGNDKNIACSFSLALEDYFHFIFIFTSAVGLSHFYSH